MTGWFRRTAALLEAVGAAVLASGLWAAAVLLLLPAVILCGALLLAVFAATWLANQAMRGAVALLRLAVASLATALDRRPL